MLTMISEGVTAFPRATRAASCSCRLISAMCFAVIRLPAFIRSSTWTISSIDRWDKSVPERTSSLLIKCRDRYSQGGVQPLVALVRGLKLQRHREHPQMGLALVSPAQPIASGVKPYFSPVGRFDDASRMNGAEMLPRWRLKSGSHKDIGAVTGVHRPASCPTEQISRNAPIATPNQLTLTRFSRHHHLHIRLVLEPSFKQGFEQTSLTVLLYRIHDHVHTFHARLCSPRQSDEVGVQLC